MLTYNIPLQTITVTPGTGDIAVSISIVEQPSAVCSNFGQSVIKSLAQSGFEQVPARSNHANETILNFKAPAGKSNEDAFTLANQLLSAKVNRFGGTLPKEKAVQLA